MRRYLDLRWRETSFHQQLDLRLDSSIDLHAKSKANDRSAGQEN